MLFFSNFECASACISIGPTGHCVRIGAAAPEPTEAD
jgi:hypothetical protein